jgi:crotonobetainyl-CoA:carnitine CoA-transferase CaiB-like acyl-CoA transferase
LTLILKTEEREYWLDGLEELGVPASPVNDITRVFTNPQIQHRGMNKSVPHEAAVTGAVDLISNPIKFLKTPVS